jgi:lipid-binding SYLF domain-containing protein
MVHSQRPLQEKMALFWHNHFATTYSKVAGAMGAVTAAKILALKEGELSCPQGQFELFRRSALGNFRGLLVDVAKNQAMLVFLDGRTNMRERSQEKFAREITELFTFGLGNYTEADVYAAASVFTGWNLRKATEGCNNDPATYYEFRFNAAQHETAAKSFTFPIYPDGGTTIPARATWTSTRTPLASSEERSPRRRKRHSRHNRDGGGVEHGDRMVLPATIPDVRRRDARRAEYHDHGSSYHLGTMHRLLATAVALAALIFPLALRAQQGSDEARRVREAATVFDEIMMAEDNAIPNAILGKAEGIAIFPGTVRAGFIVGAMRGRGVLSARTEGSWSPPAFFTLTGGSVGLQVGGQAADVILVIKNRRGLENLLSNQFTLGVDAAVAAGPVGRDAKAATDLQLRAQILSYSRARGLFAGLTVSGSTVRQDRDANERFYGQRLDSQQIVFGGGAGTPEPVPLWIQTLDRHTR